MTAKHARVKQLFLAAVELPKEEREAYLKRECAGETDIRSEVETLLDFHSTKTLFAGDATARPGPAPSDVLYSNVRPDVSLVPADAADKEVNRETRGLLRDRLMAVALVMALGILSGLILGLIGQRLTSLVLHVVAVGLFLLIFAVLRRGEDITLSGLRTIELLVMLTATVVTMYTDFMQMVTAVEDDNLEAFLLAANSIYLTWSLVIFVYGVFMPNSWQRAARILIPGAFLPHLLSLIAWTASPGFQTMLTFDRISDSVAAPLIAAGVSVYAAYIIHRVRLNAIQARRLAQYRLKERIGSGGMGDVYEAEHLLLKRHCAIKLIRPEMGSDPNTLARFQREVKATSALTHPNTIEIFDYGISDDGVFYYVMEFLGGMSLQELVDKAGPLSPGRTVFLLRQACGALQEAHKSGLIHRDIKPANMFAAERGGMYDYLKLLDFGMVREANAKSDLTGVNTIGGTPLYMPPEQAFDTSNANELSDLYALGAVGYFLLTGRPPFNGESIAEILIAHASEEVTPPNEVDASIPLDLSDAVVRCLSKLPSRRFASAAELRHGLDRCECAEDWNFDLAHDWWANAEFDAPHASDDEPPASTSAKTES